MKRGIIGFCIVILAVLTASIIGGSFYMLDYSLAPDPKRTDTDSCYRHQFERYPETKAWVDSLRSVNALRDTFITMKSEEGLRVGDRKTGKKHHALYIQNGKHCTALVLHGWRNSSIDFLFLARIYDKELGYNVVIPDLYAHGQSEGEAIQMGWKDADDMMQWLRAFKTDTMVVHGVSMGAATTMMLSSRQMPEDIKDIRFIEDCGYTSVWDEFAGQLKEEFGLSEFPLMYSTSLLCKLRYGWSFGEASAIRAVAKCHYPMLFIHGDSDTFVPTEMVYRLYAAKPEPKQLWITKNTSHACSYLNHKEEYIKRVKDFLIEN